jgi:hypothetical protein
MRVRRVANFFAVHARRSKNCAVHLVAGAPYIRSRRAALNDVSTAVLTERPDRARTDLP